MSQSPHRWTWHGTQEKSTVFEWFRSMIKFLAWAKSAKRWANEVDEMEDLGPKKRRFRFLLEENVLSHCDSFGDLYMCAYLTNSFDVGDISVFHPLSSPTYHLTYGCQVRWCCLWTKSVNLVNIHKSPINGEQCFNFNRPYSASLCPWNELLAKLKELLANLMLSDISKWWRQTVPPNSFQRHMAWHGAASWCRGGWNVRLPEISWDETNPCEKTHCQAAPVWPWPILTFQPPNLPHQNSGPYDDGNWGPVAKVGVKTPLKWLHLLGISPLLKQFMESTPPKTNREPENEPLEEEIPMKNHHF